MLLLLLFVGETTRGDHFSLNGYARQDSPELATRDVTSLTNCRQPG
jgi:lipid A ethanolaminephosphotransferase